MSRKTHLVGAWPGTSGPDAMETAFERVGPHLVRMSDGETGEPRSLWVTPTIEGMRWNVDVVAIRKRLGDDYTPDGHFKVKDGGALDPDNIWHGYYAAFHESYPAFKVLRDRFEQPQVSFQVGIPAPIDYAGIIFGFATAAQHPEYEEAFRQSTVREITQIQEEAGDDVIFQLETVNGLIGITRAPDEAKQAVAEKVAAGFHKLIADCPKGTRFGAHLCLGDFHHKAMGTMTDATPVVLLSNALAKNFPKNQKLEYIHVPFAAAAEPPTMDESWYTPLKDLDIPDDVAFIAGFIHENVPAEDNEKLLAMIEGFAGRQVDVAAACGLGRRPDPEQAWDAMDKAVALIES